MHNTPKDHAQHLYDLTTREAPLDDYNHHEWIRPSSYLLELRLCHIRSVHCGKQLPQVHQGNRNPVDVEKQKKHWTIILLNLTFDVPASLVARSNGFKFYSQDNYWTRRLGLSYRPMKTIVDYLKDNNFVSTEKAKPTRTILSRLALALFQL